MDFFDSLNAQVHLPLWSACLPTGKPAEYLSACGRAVKCTRLLCRVFKHFYDMLG